MVLLIELVVFDLENVIIDGEAIDEIGKLANVEDEIAAITLLPDGFCRVDPESIWAQEQVTLCSLVFRLHEPECLSRNGLSEKPWKERCMGKSEKKLKKN